MEQQLGETPKEVLVDIVKSVQKRGLRGSGGDWVDFLNRQDAGSSKIVYDPSKRSVDILVAFLKTFSGKEEHDTWNVLRAYKRQTMVSRRLRESLDVDIPVQRLMRLTIDHPKYMQRYAFPLQNEEWVNISMGKVSKALKNNVIIAVDCEMVLCEGDSEELVQVCAVDQNLEVKVDMLVKPKKAIVDYRTNITGLSFKDLDGITCSLVDAQKCLKKLLFNGATLAGHGLHNDLQALKICHPYVIDTSHIFKYENAEHITPSLKNLCKSVLEYELRHEGEPHNCLSDARAVMRLVLAKLDGHTDDLKNPPVEASDDYLKRLLLHKIPIDVPYKELRGLFPGKYNVKFLGECKRAKDSYSTFVEFKDLSDAQNAFCEIRGLLGEDTARRPQKRISMRLSNGRCFRFCVRGSFCNYNKQFPESKVVKSEAVEDEINSIVTSMKRCSELDRADTPVKRKHVDRKEKYLQEGEGCGADKHEPSLVDVENGEDCGNDKCGFPLTVKRATPGRCGHAEEVDRLMQELKRRDDNKMSEIDTLRRLLKEREDEIFDLQKTVYDLMNAG